MSQINRDYTYKLVRTNDNLIKYADKIHWLGWNEDGSFKEEYHEPVIGASLVLDLFYGGYYWMTTSIKSFEEKEDCLTFITQNSEYKLYKL